MATGVERKRIAKPADERRQDLLDAAVRVFTEKGLQHATVADITEAAGVAKGTFYLHFASKEQLLGALKESFVDAMLERAASLFTEGGPPDWWGATDAAIVAMIDFMLERRDLIHVFIQEGITPESQEIFALCQTKLQGMFADGIARGIEAGAFGDVDPELTATLLRNAIHGTVQNAILYGEELDRDRLVASATELARKVLAP
jgi:AcrR family transcriptional regulator